MKSMKALLLQKNRLFLLIIICLVFFSPISAAQTIPELNLGHFTPGTIKVVYQNVSLNTYNAYGTNYIAISDLRLLGFNVTYTAVPKAINIISPAAWPQTTTMNGLQVTPSSFSYYDGHVLLGNFETQCLSSNGRLFIPVGALSDLGTLTINGATCTFVPSCPPPVKATETTIINLTDVAVTTTILDLYYTDKVTTYSSTFTLVPGEVRERMPHTEGDPLHIATLIQSVSGNGIIYTNYSLRGQVNNTLLKRYAHLQGKTLLEDYGDPIEIDAILDAEDFVNSKNLSSPTKYLVWTNIKEQRTYVFTGSKNNWSLLKCFICSTGRDRTPTPKGTFALTYKVSSFGQAKGYCCKYAFGFIDSSYLYHSIIYDKTGTYLLENKGVLGKKASQGCIRFSVDHAKWFYDNMVSSTTVYIS